MTPSSSAKAIARERRKAAAAAVVATERRREAVRSALRTGLVIVAVVAVLAAIYLATRGGDETAPGADSGGSGRYAYQIGDPGPGEEAHDFTLPSTDGGEVSLTNFRGKTVLTYWHEGLGCQPCWDQIRDLEANQDALKDAGIDAFVSITSGPVDLLAQKMSDDGLASTTLADTDLAVSKQWQMNQYGMMGDSRDGHSFVLIGPDGKILWRADYGGAPNYTMYLPVEQLVSDLEKDRIQ